MMGRQAVMASLAMKGAEMYIFLEDAIQIVSQK